MEKFDSFWSYSLALYSRADVRKSVLALQDELGADVNVLLLCCWAARQGRALDLEACREISVSWQGGVVANLRAARRRIDDNLVGDGAMAREAKRLRKRIATLELEAERIEQAWLAATTTSGGNQSPSAADAVDAAATGLVRYLASLSAEWPEQTVDVLAALLCAGFPELSAPEVGHRLREMVSQSGIGGRDVAH